MSDFSLNAIQLAGSITLVGTTFDNPVEDISLVYSFEDASRGTIDASADLLVTEAAKPTTYVKLVGDINAFVSHLASSDSSLNDDAWGLNQITVKDGAVSIDSTTVNMTLTDDSSIEEDFSFSLVVTSDVSSGLQKVGQTTVVGDSSTVGKMTGTTSAVWSYYIKVSVSTAGALSIEHSLYDASQTLTVDPTVESSLLAQQLYVSSIWSDVNATSTQNHTLDVSGADTFTVTLDTTSQDSGFRAAIDASFADISGEPYLTTVDFTVNAVSQDNESAFSLWANTKGIDGSNNDALFEEDDELWVSESGSLTNNVVLTLNQYDGTASDVITLPFGVKLCQSANGARV